VAGSAAAAGIECLMDVADVVEQPCFRPGRLLRMVVAPAAPLAQPRPLLVEAPAFVDAWAVDWHRTGHARRSYDVSCIFACDAEVMGRGAVLLEGSLVTSPELMPDYVRRLLPDPDWFDIARQRTLAPRIIERPCVVFAGFGIDVYGHFIIETLPRLMTALRVLAGADERPAFLLDSAAPAWLREALHNVFAIPAADMVPFDRFADRIVLRRAIIPTLASFDGAYHPYAGSVFEQVADMAGARAARLDVRRVYLTRVFHSMRPGAARRCVNGPALAAIAASEFGFSIVAAETLPWRAQVALCAGADMIAGDYGSALHNAAFAGAGTRVAAIGLRALDQSYLGALRGHRNAYLRVAGEGDYAVDPELFRAYLDAVLTRRTQPGPASLATA
jgi:capsular polysaccharide biosynthesis protein